MGKLKLNHFALDDNFHLIAIHSNSEIFKIAFEINNMTKSFSQKNRRCFF